MPKMGREFKLKQVLDGEAVHRNANDTAKVIEVQWNPNRWGASCLSKWMEKYDANLALNMQVMF